MNYPITEQDKILIQQPTVNYRYRIFIEDDNRNRFGILENIKVSNYTIDSNSTTRRTIQLSIYNIADISSFLYLYMKMNFVFEIGIQNIIDDSYNWYPCGTYIMSETSTTYDSTNNVLSTTLVDWSAKLDGTRNGQVGGAPTIIIQQKDSEGNITTIQKALINFITSEGITKDYIIEDIGEFYGIQSMNPDYLSYREDNPDWNKMPYDIEFSAGDTQQDMISEVVNLYPNVQEYFDVYNNLCVNMIPSCINDPIILDNSFIEKILLGTGTENVTYDIQSVKNVTEIFGKLFEIDRTSEVCTYDNNGLYSLTLDEYTEYISYELIAFKPQNTNGNNTRIKINSLPEIPLFLEYSSVSIPQNTFVINEYNVIRLNKNSDGSFIAYYLGQYQPHALCVLTNNLNDDYYTKNYFENKYNCKNVVLREENSPFAVQKIGEILDSKSGDEFDNILSNSVAEQNAIYQNKKSSSMNETIQISTKMIPWLDVNYKIEYKKSNGNLAEYIIQSISNDIESYSSIITLQKFYPLYYD